MKITVDHDLCEGHTRCMKTAPEVFDVREDDKSYVLIEHPGEELRSKVELAVKLCPRQAISIAED